MSRPTLPSSLAALCIIAALTGCDTSSTPPVERVRQSALLEPGDLVLARRHEPDMVLIATPEPVREGIDPFRVLRLQDPPDFPGVEEGMRVLDAQWMDDERLLTLGADRVLRLHTEEGSASLDREVLGPLSVSANRVAYVYGEPPDLFLRVLEVSTRRAFDVAHIAPAWSPALSADGEEVLFTASHQGRPHLFVRRRTGEVETIPTGLRTPSSATAPIWRGQDLFFEDERGVVHLDLETASIEARYDGATLLPHDGSSQIDILEAGKVRTIATLPTQGVR